MTEQTADSHVVTGEPAWLDGELSRTGAERIEAQQQARAQDQAQAQAEQTQQDQRSIGAGTPAAVTETRRLVFSEVRSVLWPATYSVPAVPHHDDDGKWQVEVTGQEKPAFSLWSGTDRGREPGQQPANLQAARPADAAGTHS